MTKYFSYTEVLSQHVSCKLMIFRRPDGRTWPLPLRGGELGRGGAGGAGAEEGEGAGPGHTGGPGGRPGGRVRLLYNDPAA